MKEASQVIGLPLMGIKEGQLGGIAKDFVIDPKTKGVKSILLKLDKSYDYRELLTTDVIGIGKDYIISQSLDNAKQIDLSGVQMTMLGMKCISSSGDILGSIQNFTYEEKTGVIQSLQLDNGKDIEGGSIIALSNSLMFVDEEGTVKDESASAFENEQREYMMGRTVTADLVDANGTVVIKKGVIVNDEIIHLAEEKGLSVDLTLNLE